MQQIRYRQNPKGEMLSRTWAPSVLGYPFVLQCFCLNFGAFGFGLPLRFTGFWHEITRRLLAEVQHFACRSDVNSPQRRFRFLGYSKDSRALEFETLRLFTCSGIRAYEFRCCGLMGTCAQLGSDSMNVIVTLKRATSDPIQHHAPVIAANEHRLSL